MVTVALPSFAVAVATFGNVSVVMIALAALSQMSARALCTSSSITPANLLACKGSPITPVDASSTSFFPAPDRLGGKLGGECRCGAAALARECIGVAGIDDEGARLAGFEFGAAPVDRRGRALANASAPRAVVVPGASSASSTSVRFAYLIPAAAVASLTPSIGRQIREREPVRGERSSRSCLLSLYASVCRIVRTVSSSAVTLAHHRRSVSGSADRISALN